MSSTIKSGFLSLGNKTLLLASYIALAVLLPDSFSSVNAYDLGDGRTVFEKAPVLVRSAASYPVAGSSSTYQFTIQVPEDAGEALGAVTISQKENPEQINFDISKSKAFIGDSFAGGKDLSLADIGGSQIDDSNEVTIVFDEPVEPGNTVTVSLRTKRNPRSGGIYLFGVTAYPEGENSSGLYLGSGQLHFLRH